MIVKYLQMKKEQLNFIFCQYWGLIFFVKYQIDVRFYFLNKVFHSK